MVLTPGRSGSMWLAWALQKLYHDVLAVHEVGPPIKHLAFEYYNGNVTETEAAKLLRGIKVPALAAAKLYFKKSHYIEINRNLFSLAGPLRHALDVDKVTTHLVGLVGDGRSFVKSMLNKGAYREYRQYGWFVPSGHPDWDSYTRVQKTTWHWVEKIRLILASVDSLIRLDDITRGNNALCLTYWNSIAKTLSLPPVRDRVLYAKLRTTRVNHWPCYEYKSFSDLPTRDQNDFWEIASDTMSLLGYPTTGGVH